ncbi:MAG TPA: glycoside hydrolase family 3 N-terminal domain-containing protein [Propionicimonas sp.]|uniref:glycoside hydrolase family 3 protein n=1 Tax=Propionicimonas sp. TaxID=1955623 RepID=UPI002F3EC702
MTELRRAIRATLMPGFVGLDLPDWLAAELAAGLGSVCLFGMNVSSPGQLRALTAAIHAAGPSALVAIDEEGGDVTRLHHRDGSPHPSAAYLGSLDDVRVTEAVAADIGAQLVAAGVDLNLAPVADVNSNPLNPVIGVRSFGADAGLAARHVAAYTRGLQGAGVGAVAKHFPGHGDTATDSHRALPTITVDAGLLASRELVPFRSAVAAGTLGVMTSHILVPAIDPELPATLSAPVLRLLRDDLGFTGAIVSDALDMAGASKGRGIPEAAVLALAAGVDLLCIGTENTAGQLAGIVDHVLEAIRSGRLSEDRVRDAAERVAVLSAGVAALRHRAAVPGELREERSKRAEGPPPLSPEGFWLRAPIAPLTAPVFVRLDSVANIAAGEDTVWGVGGHLSGELDTHLPGATCVTAATLAEVNAVLAAHPDRPLVVQGRDLARVDFLARAATLIKDRRPDAVLVELGWPQLPGVPPVDIATYGAGRGASTCLITLLSEGAR